MISKVFIFCFLIGYVFSASIEDRQAGDSCPLICPANWMPVCGSDGKTYGNMCEFHGAHCRDTSLTVVSQSACV